MSDSSTDPPPADSAAPASSSKGFWFDEAAADRAVQFFEKYQKHVKGKLAGQPLKLEDWQKNDIIRPLFGWKRPDGTRRYREAYIEIPRKNGKSTLAAGIANYLTFADGEPGAEVYSAAGDREQAAIVFDSAKEMVLGCEALKKRCQVFKRSISVPLYGAIYRVLSADAKLKHGLNAHGVIFDEVHVQPNRWLWDVLKTSTGARSQPLVVSITTAGYDRNSICWELHDYAVKVKAGEIEDDSLLVAIYAAEQDDDWTSPEIWKKANPNLGISVNLDYLAAECKRAQELPGYENSFRQLHLNQWTQQEKRWMKMETWDASAGTIDKPELAGKICFGGLDLASTTDIAALVLDFPIEVAVPVEGGEVREVFHKWLPFFWIPEENMRERVKRDRVPYDVWVRKGLMKSTPGNVIDYKVIKADILKLAELYNIKELAYDRWNATQIVQDLQDEGVNVVPMGQGFGSMSAPTRELMTLTLQKRLNHEAHPILRWMVGNIVVKQDPAGNIKPDKAKSTSRIDGVVAGIMALDRATRGGGKKKSVYEDRGVRAV